MTAIGVEVILHSKEHVAYVPLGPEDAGVVIQAVGQGVRIQAGDLSGISELYNVLNNVTSLVAAHPDSQAGRGALRERIGDVLTHYGVDGVTENLLDDLASQVIS